MKIFNKFALAFIILAASARANDFSFTGAFIQDDNVQAFTFSVGATSNVTLETYSYAGGVNAAGQTIASDGFDPILALFDSTGQLIGQNDDGGANVAADSETGQRYDTFLNLSTLAAGIYTVTIMQFDNFATGPNISDGFARAGQGNFTSAAFGSGGPGGFYDVTGDQNDGRWAFDILGVNSASTVPDSGTTFSLLGLAMLGLAALRHKGELRSFLKARR